MMNYLAELVHACFENRIPDQIPEGIKVDELIDIANRSHLAYIIFSALIKLDIEEEKKNIMRDSVRYSALKTLAQVYEAKIITQKFEQAGVRHQMLKGTIMKHVYPRPEMREMSDIDCMVYENEEKFKEAENIMYSIGYKKVEDIKHHAVFRKGPFLVFEMHWDLYEKTVDKDQYIYYKDTTRVRLKEGLHYTYEFSDEDFYVYLISHMAKHFYEQGCGIRNLLDIYIYRKEFNDKLNWKIVEEELEKCGLIDFERHASKLTAIWLQEDMSTDFYNYMFQYMVDCGIYGKKENGVWGQLAKQESENASFMFPNYEYMKNQYEWLEGKKILLPVAWVIRAFSRLNDKDARKRLMLLRDMDESNMCECMYRTLRLNFVNK